MPDDQWPALFSQADALLQGQPVDIAEASPAAPFAHAFLTAVECGNVFHLAGMNRLLEVHFPQGLGSSSGAAAAFQGSAPVQATLTRLQAMWQWLRAALEQGQTAPALPWSPARAQPQAAAQGFLEEDAFQAELEKHALAAGRPRGLRRRRTYTRQPTEPVAAAAAAAAAVAPEVKPQLALPLAAGTTPPKPSPSTTAGVPAVTDPLLDSNSSPSLTVLDLASAASAAATSYDQLLGSRLAHRRGGSSSSVGDGVSSSSSSSSSMPSPPQLRPVPSSTAAVPTSQLPNETSQLSWPLPWGSPVMLDASELAAGHARELGAVHATLAATRTTLLHGTAVCAARMREEEAERSLLSARLTLASSLAACLQLKRAALQAQASATAGAEQAAVGAAEEGERAALAAWGAAQLQAIGAATEASLRQVQAEGAWRVSRELGESARALAEERGRGAAAARRPASAAEAYAGPAAAAPASAAAAAAAALLPSKLAAMRSIVREQLAGLPPHAICKALQPLDGSAQAVRRRMDLQALLPRLQGSTHPSLRSLAHTLAEVGKRALLAGEPASAGTGAAPFHFHAYQPSATPFRAAAAAADPLAHYAATRRRQPVQLFPPGSLLQVDPEAEQRNSERLREQAGSLVRAFLSKSIVEAPYDPKFGAVLSGIVDRLHRSLRLAQVMGEGQGAVQGAAAGRGGSSYSLPQEDPDAWLNAPIQRFKHSHKVLDGFLGGYTANF